MKLISKQGVGDKNMKLISKYIAPWALPREDIPLHLVWESPFPYNYIRINLPPDIILKEFFNVDSYTREGTQYIIKKLKTPTFFGLTVASKDIIEEQHISRKIEIEFVLDDGEIYSLDFMVNVFRPYVSLVESPESITVIEKDKHRAPALNIILKHSGFGSVEIRNEISTGGDFVERAEPLYCEIMRRMASTFRLDEVKAEDQGIKINPIYLQNKAKEYIEKIEKGIFPLAIEKKDIEDFRDWVIDKNNRQKVMEFISKQVENLLVDSLLFYFERHPADNVQMPQGKPVMFIESATRRVRLRFRYRDAMLNEYNPINIAVDIDDKGEGRTRPILLPINIKWIFEIINPIEECK